MKHFLLIVIWLNLFLFFVKFILSILSCYRGLFLHTHVSPASLQVTMIFLEIFNHFFSLSEKASGYFPPQINDYSISFLANKVKPLNGLFFQRFPTSVPFSEIHYVT